MGSGQSQPQSNGNSEPSTPSRTITIDRTEIPEAYKHVRISENVYNRVQGQVNHIPAPAEEKNVQQTTPPPPPVLKPEKIQTVVPEKTQHNLISVQQTDDAKRVFEETVKKVENQFFNYRRENACADNETNILKCLGNNTETVLQCQSLWNLYNRCISDFHDSVLKEKPTAPLVT